MRVLLTGLTFLVCFGLLPAQRFQTLNEHYSIPRTNEIIQDCFGFLWLATSDGLVSYNGYTVHKYSNDVASEGSIPGNDINALLSDTLGNLWVGMTNAGLAIFNRTSGKFHRVCLEDASDSCITDIHVNALSYGQDRRVWVGTNQGVFVVEAANDTATRTHFIHSADDPTTLSNDLVMSLLCDSKGRMWVGTRNGVNLLSGPDQFINQHTDSSFVRGQIVDITQQPDGKVWVSPRQTPYPLFYFDEGDQKLKAYTFFPPSKNREYRVSFDFHGRMWVSVRGIGAYVHGITSGELEFFDPNKGYHHGFKTYSSGQPFTDSYGNIWIGGSALLKWPYSAKPFQSVLSDGYQVTAVFADAEYIWFSGRKPLRWNRASQEVEEYWPEGIPVNHRPSSMRNPEKAFIYKYANLGDEQLLFTTTRNVFIWNIADDTFREMPTTRGGPFRDFEFGKNHQIWICANQYTPVEFDLRTGVNVSLGERGNNDITTPRVVARDSSGYLWFGSARDGLFRFDEENWETRHFMPLPGDSMTSPGSQHIHDILVHSDGTLWIGTNLGIDHYDPVTGRFRHFKKHDGLTNENVVSLLEDGHGNIWMGTHDGLAKLDITQRTFTRFSRSEGLCNIVFSERAAYRDAKGWLYFGGHNGVDFFHPDSIGFNPIPPDIYVNAVRLHNKPVQSRFSPGSVWDLSFRYNENFIEIELIALHYTSPESNHYAYRLERQDMRDDQWRDLGTNRVVTLANIAPGHYALYARAANADDVWSEGKMLIRLEIKPPFWQTAQFYTIMIICIGVIVGAIYLYRIRQIRRQEELKTTFNKRIAEIELKALQAQMNPHFLFNSLNSVKSLIGKKENKDASMYLTRFSQLIRQVLNNSRKKFVKLSDELEALRLYLELESLRFKEKFSFGMSVDEDVNADFVEVPPMLLQPYVENAIWHGLLPMAEGDRRVSVSVRRHGDYIQMVVEDNGIGRETARMLQKRSGKESLGMKITGDRLKFLQQLYGREARVVIDDLQDPTGTRVTIILPIPE